MILNGEVRVYVPKPSKELENDKANHIRRHVYDEYMNFIKEGMKSRAKNIQALEKRDSPIKRHATAFNFAEPDPSTLTWMPSFIKSPTLFKEESSKTAPTIVLEEEDIVDNVYENIKNYILREKNRIWPGDKSVDFDFDEKLLLLNHKKACPYFDHGFASFKKLNTLRDQDYFGEIALIFQTTRTASIIASKDTHLLSLTSVDYVGIFQSHIDAVKAKVEFISGLFPGFSRTIVSKFCYLIEEQTFQRNEVIYKEGDEPESFFIVRRGEVQVS